MMFRFLEENNSTNCWWGDNPTTTHLSNLDNTKPSVNRQASLRIQSLRLLNLWSAYTAKTACFSIAWARFPDDLRKFLVALQSDFAWQCIAYLIYCQQFLPPISYDVAQMYGSCPIPGEDYFNYNNKPSDTWHINPLFGLLYINILNIFGKGKFFFCD